MNDLPKLNDLGKKIIGKIQRSDGVWNRGPDSLGKEIGESMRSCKNALVWLGENGWLDVTTRKGKPNSYQISDHATKLLGPVAAPPLGGWGYIGPEETFDGNEPESAPPDTRNYPDIIGVEEVERTPDGEHVHIPPGFVAAPAPEVLDDDGGEWREFQDELNKRRALQRLGVGRKMYDTFSDIMDRHPQTVEVITRLDDPEIVRQQRLEDAQARDRELEEWKKERPPRRSKPDEVVINTFADKNDVPITCCARCGKRGDHKRNMVLDEKERLVCMNEIACRKELRAKKAALQAEIDEEDRLRAEARARREDA